MAFDRVYLGEEFCVTITRYLLPSFCQAVDRKSVEKLIHIVDDDEAIRSSLDMLFSSVDLEVTTHVDGKAFMDYVENHDADSIGCVLLDVRMPGLSGVEVHKQLRDRGFSNPVIFITGHGDIPMAVQAMHEGAFDFIQKPFRDQDLLDRVTAAMNEVESLSMTKAKLSEYRSRYQSLTPRETEVMAMIVAGHANKVVAADLNLSQRTVEIHRSRVMEKMKARSLAELVRLAVQLESAK